MAIIPNSTCHFYYCLLVIAKLIIRKPPVLVYPHCQPPLDGNPRSNLLDMPITFYMQKAITLAVLLAQILTLTKYKDDDV